MPPFKDRTPTPRKAKTYSAQEALFFLIVKTLVRDLGLQISNVAKVSGALLSICTSKPMGELSDCWLMYAAGDKTLYLKYWDDVLKEKNASAMVLVPFAEHINTISSYLIGENIGAKNLELNFPPQPIAKRELGNG